MPLKSNRTRIANILRTNATLQKLFTEFNVDFELVQNDLIKDALLPADNILQINTVYNLAENPSADVNIANLNEDVSTKLGLYPAIIGTPHESNYRNYLSSEGTRYTYLLKWLYYTYKYFNEEQFFFNKLLEKFVPDYDGQIVSSTTYLKVYFDGLGILLDTLDQKIEDLYTLGDIDTVDEKYLQYLAQLLGYQKEDFSIENISFRELIKNLVDIYQTKGTEYSFTLFFKLLGFDAVVNEYYWDRDAQNSGQFGSISNIDYLYYLTTQNPRTRTVQQIENPSQAQPIQPISPKDWVLPKDLREFAELQSTYSLDEVLGFKNSGLTPEDRFTYFKTNFIQFKLIQFYTKQDLTAKDTETILKYVKFLTPIYISSFIEVATRPYQDFFEMSNPEAGSITLAGDPGIPPWVDILLPFIFITLKDYIPLNLSPAPENAVVIAQHAWSDLNSNGISDSALPIIFGNPAIGISIEGTVLLNVNKDLSTNKFISIKIDKGRGIRLFLPGNTIQTYAQLATKLNTEFTANSLDASAIVVGITPNLDIRVYSNTLGTTSKVFMASGLSNDLLSALSTTLDAPVDGIQAQKGYQEFGLSFVNSSDLTGLNPSVTYTFYIDLDIEDFIEVDASGPVAGISQPQHIVNAINNHYEKNVVSNFVTSTTPEYVTSDITTSDKVLIAYRDTSSNNGRLVYMNSDGSIYRSGINFTLYDCRNITLASSKDSNVGRSFVAWYDTTNDFAKWTVFDNEGVKIITEQQLEPSGSLVQEIVATTLSNNKIVVAYSVNAPASALIVKTFDLTGPTLIDTAILPTGGITNLAIESLVDNLVVGGNTGSGGTITYLDEDLAYSFGSYVLSTKTFTSPGPAADISFIETANSEVFITWRAEIVAPPDYTGYFTILSNTGSLVKVETQFTLDDLDLVSTSIASNGNIFILYSKSSDGFAYFQVISLDGDILKKEKLFYNDTAFTEATLSLTSSNAMTASLALNNKGYFTVWDFLGEISSISLTSKLVIQSLQAGDTWDDTVDNYADTSDRGHLFEMNGEVYEFDNFAEYHRGLGVSFVQERNRYNTFFNASPDDDVIPIIQETLSLAFTLLVSSNEFPSSNVDKAGWHVRRNGYISRAQGFNVNANREMGYYVRHQDYSEDIRVDPRGANREINWPQWNRDNTSDDDWSSWSLAIDYFRPNVNYPIYNASGQIVIGGTYSGGQYFEFTAPLPTGSAIFAGNGQPYGPFFEFTAPIPFGTIITSGAGISSAYYIYYAPWPTGIVFMSGSAITKFSQGFVFVASGKITLSGSVKADKLGYIKVATGGIVMAGAARTATGNVYRASGGIVMAGAGVTSRAPAYRYIGSGFTILSGTAPRTIVRTYTATGGIVMAGAAVAAAGYITTASGGIIIAGSAIYYPEKEFFATGTITMSGTGLYVREIARTMSGGILIFGAAPKTIQITRTMSGTVTMAGTGGYQEGGL
jgi:hypothetical protein